MHENTFDYGDMNPEELDEESILRSKFQAELNLSVRLRPNMREIGDQLYAERMSYHKVGVIEKGKDNKEEVKPRDWVIPYSAYKKVRRVATGFENPIPRLKSFFDYLDDAIRAKLG